MALWTDPVDVVLNELIDETDWNTDQDNFRFIHSGVLGKSLDFTVDDTEAVVYVVNTSGGAVIATLPAPASIIVVPIWIRRDGSNLVTLLGTVDGVVNPTLPNDGDSIAIVSDGVVWRSLNQSSVGSSVSGKPFIVFGVASNEPPASNAATPDTRNSISVLDFDDTVDEVSVFGSIMSLGYSGNGLTVEVHWAATSAVAGDVKWNVQFERMVTDMDADDFAAAQTATSTTKATSGLLTQTDIVFTDGAQIDSIVASDPFRVKVERDATNGGDTMVGDAEVVRIVVRET